MIFAKLFFFFLFVCFCSWTSTQRLFNELQKKRGEKQPTRLQIQHYRKSRNVYIWRDTQKKKTRKERCSLRLFSVCLLCVLFFRFSQSNKLYLSTARKNQMLNCNEKKRRREKKKQSSVESLKKYVSLLFFSIIIRGEALLSLSPFSSSLAVNVWVRLCFCFLLFSLAT